MLLPGVLYFLFFLFLVQVGHLGRGQSFLFQPLGPMHPLMQKYGQLLLLLSLVDVFFGCPMLYAFIYGFGMFFCATEIAQSDERLKFIFAHALTK